MENRYDRHGFSFSQVVNRVGKSSGLHPSNSGGDFGKGLRTVAYKCDALIDRLQ